MGVSPNALRNTAPETSRTANRRTFWLKVCFMLALLLVLMEFMLRVQQKVGPFYDLELSFLDLITMSDELNHVPTTIGNKWDSMGIKIMGNLIPEDEIKLPNSRKILFMGDSFMQGYGGKDDIAWHVWSQYREQQLPMIPFNAGYSSYSPSIYVVQSRKLIPLIKPDNVVIVIDNTDMPDDYYRYAKLTVRDENGRIKRVTHNSAIDNRDSQYRAVRSHYLYIFRFLHKIYFTRLSSEQKAINEREKQVIEFISDDATDAHAKYHAEVALFEKNLNELADVLIDGLGAADKVIWVCHPHPQHIQVAQGEATHQRLVFDSVKKVAEARGIHYYDATSDLKREFGERYKDFYLPGDVYFHFNAAGLAIYSKCIFNALPGSWKK